MISRDRNEHFIVTSILTGVLFLMWIASLVARMFNPAEDFTSIDAVMVVVIGYWFTAAARHNGTDTPK